MKKIDVNSLTRRHFVQGAASAIALASLPLSHNLLAATETNIKQPMILSGNQFDLEIGYQKVNFTGKERIATTLNGVFPGPILRWKEGERVTLRVTNRLKEESSIHWHGIVLPSTMDGSPGFDFAGIKPGETFEYQFDVKQSGSYWYHSHSGFQEQTGLLGGIIIDPKEPDPVAYDREMLVILSDWSDHAPDQVYAKLKKMSHYYNYRERTVGDAWGDLKTKGIARTWSERSMWNQMRMSDADIADVSGSVYTYLMNGCTPAQGWMGLFKTGEKLRLRIINGAAMTMFDVRIPGLQMTIVAADGQNIQPVTVDEFRIGNAETYDVIVTPEADRAYTLFAQNSDRTGFARGTLTTNPNSSTEIPAMDAAPILGHQDMGMDMSGMDHSAHSVPAANHAGHDMSNMNHSGHDMSAMTGMDHSSHDMSTMAGMDMSSMAGMDHSGHDMSAMQDAPVATNLAKAGFGSNFNSNGDSTGKITHLPSEFGPHVDNHSEAPPSGLTDPGIGLRDHQQLYGRKVLSYADLRSLHPTRDKREPTREIELHLTGNMQRYMWSINGLSFMDAAPLQLKYGERVRIILFNDTMMTHPIHLHGMWSELETGDPDFIPRKHTVLVHPGSKISYLLTADAKGNWAYHCHLLYHMLGMMRQVRVV
jgi:CopA family copper-resistance protein